MSCGCKTSGDSTHNCGTKSSNGCDNVNSCGNSYKLSVFNWLSGIYNPSSNQTDLVEIRFKNDRKSFYKNTNNLPLHIGSVVTVESNPGHDVGVVSLTGELVKIQAKKKNFPEDQALKIYRLANQKDIDTWQNFRKKEDKTKQETRKIAANIGLEMKIADVEYQGDGSKVTIYYTAENRIDFRQLIKDLASAFHTKIDMKQIGYRQESAKIGGIGSCGRELCCSTWLTDFRSVNTNAARYQQLSINPQKLAGQCGKLKCCLNFELDTYLDSLNHFPSSSTILETEKGKAFCIKIDVFKNKMWFAYTDHSIAWYDLDLIDVKKCINLNKKGEKSPALEDLKNIDVKPINSDLIQENNVNRFEEKARHHNSKNKNGKNNYQKQNHVKNKPSENRQEPKAQQQNQPALENSNQVKNQPNQNQNSKKKKFFKKKNPKPGSNG